MKKRFIMDYTLCWCCLKGAFMSFWYINEDKRYLCKSCAKDWLIVKGQSLVDDKGNEIK